MILFTTPNILVLTYASLGWAMSMTIILFFYKSMTIIFII